jgi:hypothetical protein
MQHVDSELYVANVTAFSAAPRRHAVGGRDSRSGANGHRYRGLISALGGTSASERLLALLLAAFVVTVSPALVATVRSTVSLSFQILLQAGHAGLIAFQIFGR